jgi:hypothetical protein
MPFGHGSGLAGSVQVAKQASAAMGASDTEKAAPVSVEQVCQRFEISEEARKFIRPGLQPEAFFGLLFANELYRDATHFVAHLLPKRDAVWWGCLCAWHAARPTPPREVGDALEAAVRWVRDPSEANRRAAQAPGEKVGASNAAGAVALAAFWSGGSMSRPDLPAVPPPEPLTSNAIAGAVLAAAASGDPAQLNQRHRQFLHWGADVANQKIRWQ